MRGRLEPSDHRGPRRRESKIRLRSTELLSEHDIWSDTSVDVWRSDGFKGSPSFYPVYKYQNCYSHSVVNLIAFKGHLALNHGFISRAKSNNVNYHSGTDTIDREILRVGGMMTSSHNIRTRSAYAERLAEALKADVSVIEGRYPDYHHVVLCGGKDSLNLLLLPWQNRVTVLSAVPNFPLVKEFVSRNGLPHTVVELTDGDLSQLRAEILYNACFNNLQQCRWTGELKSFADRYDQKVILWKGQMADAFTTRGWRFYAHSTNRVMQAYRRYAESVLRATNPDYLEERFFNAIWFRGAMWQGAHMSLLRCVCGVLALSAYHGEGVTKVFSEVDLRAAVTDDVRPLVGRILRGSEVKYPLDNPHPPRSQLRSGISDPEHFLAVFREMTDIPVHTEMR